MANRAHRKTAAVKFICAWKCNASMSTHCPSVPPLSVQFSPVWRVLSAILLLLLLLLTVWGKQQVLDQATTIRWSSTGTGRCRGRGSSSCSQVLLSVMKIACSRSERLRGGKRVSTEGQGGLWGGGVQSHTSDPFGDGRHWRWQPDAVWQA